MKCLSQEELILSRLIRLYENRGYRKYKPVCFEDYSLYLDNIDFLISKDVITFNGAGGRLLALRPDVTLSVINHLRTDAQQTQKIYYTENVYRKSAGFSEFREISQTGIEVIGDIDSLCEIEVAILILETLATVSDDYLLDISDMGITEALVSSFCFNAQDKAYVYTLLRSKNLHDFLRFASLRHLSPEQTEAFQCLVTSGEDARGAIARVKKISLNDAMIKTAEELELMIEALADLGYGKNIRINFSIANNADYYNGIIFNGYIEGIPHAVLSGGRYDKLPAKLGKDVQAIGFALYLGELERYFQKDNHYIDYMIIYDESTQAAALKLAGEKLKSGNSIRLARSVPDGIKFGELLRVKGEYRK